MQRRSFLAAVAAMAAPAVPPGPLVAATTIRIVEKSLTYVPAGVWIVTRNGVGDYTLELVSR